MYVRALYAMLFALCSTSVGFAGAQADSGSYAAEPVPALKPPPPPPGNGQTYKFIAKVNLFALAAKSISLQYEYGFHPKMSIALGLRLQPKQSMPFGKTVKSVVLQDAADEDDAAVQDFINNARLSGWALTPEFRYYFGKKPQQGLYLAAYLRYASYNLGWNYIFVDRDTTPAKSYPTKTNIDLKTFGGGLMLGSQWRFNHLVLDWWILGGSVNTAKLNSAVKADLSDRLPVQNAHTEAEIERLRIFNVHAQADVDKNGARINASGFVPMIRFGLCLGLAF